MQYLRKNTAVIVSVGPFLDRTDGVTLETALTITNEKITVIAETDDGSAPTLVLDNVTGATSGTDNDLNYITNNDAGMMQLELTAANTNRVGRLRVIITDAANHCPVFHEYEILPAEVYDSMIAGTDKLAVDAQEISSDSTAADNLELQFDGTGLTGDTYPATQLQSNSLSAQVSSIGSGTGAALNFPVSEDNASTPIKTVSSVGTQTGTYANTLADDGTTHQIASVGNAIDWVYGFNVGVARSASKVVLRANMAAVGDTVTALAYNFSTTSWEARTTITGTTETLYDITLLQGHTGTSGVDAGKVYLRFQYSEGDAGTLVIDEAYVQAQQSGSLAGYVNGIEVDTVNGFTGTTPYVNGTKDRPTKTWAEALTLAAATNINQFYIRAGSSITLTADLKKYVIDGYGYALALGGYDISGTTIRGCEFLSGASTAADTECFIWDSQIASATFGEVDIHNCHITGTVTLGQAGVPYLLHRCVGVYNSGSFPSLDFGAAVGGTDCNLSQFSGGIIIANLKTSDVLTVDGACDLTRAASCTGGTLNINGPIRFTNSGSGGAVVQDGRVAADTINAQADQALADYDGPTNAEMEARTLVANQYALDSTVAKDATVSKPGTAQTITANQSVNVAQVDGENVELGSLGVIGIRRKPS